MSLNEVMVALESLATERVKKRYVSLGAREPIFGVATGAMKPLSKQHMHDHALAEQLYATGNFDAMYFAGVIADPKQMTPADFERWVAQAYAPIVADFIVSVSLSETDFAQTVADSYIQSTSEITAFTGWACYEWLLGSRKDHEFDPAKIQHMLDSVVATIHQQPDVIKKVMNRFVIAVGVSFKPLHEQAIQAAHAIGDVMVTNENKSVRISNATEAIRKEIANNRIGFKRKYVRC